MPRKFPFLPAATVCLAMTLIVGSDTAAKILTGQGFSPFFIAWTRFALAAVLLAPFCGLRKSELPLFIDWRLILRAALIAAAILCILTALKTEPVANAFGAFFVGPIVSYCLSALLLGEPVTRLRSTLLLMSFLGVLLVVKPGFGMTPGIGFALLAGVLHGCYLVATRWLAGSYRPRFLLLSQLVIGAILLSPSSVGSVPPISGTAIWLITLSAIGSAIGNLLLVMINRTMPAGLVAPLIYSQLIAAAGFGYFVFGEWLDVTSLAGLFIIVACGALSLRAAMREQLVTEPPRP